jgi:group I intron endonuclease
MDEIVCVYMIQNIVNEKVYIGATKDLMVRWKHHRLALSKNRHYNFHLQSAWNMYGEQNFRLAILERIEDIAILSDREKYWICKFQSSINQSGYNFLDYQEYPNKPKRFSEEIRLRMSLAKKGKPSNRKNYRHSEETKKKISEKAKLRKNWYWTGKKMSPEACRNIGLAKKGQKAWNKGIPNSAKTRRKISEAVNKYLRGSNAIN